MKIDFDKVYQYVEQGYINKQAHPNGELFIFNYAAKAQYENCWTDEIKICRGLITDTDHRVIARPFAKFFNADQTPRSDLMWSKPFCVTTKLDGSLGIFYFWNGEPCIATRGSFMSEQARVATEILRSCYSDMWIIPGYTPLFEIIYPENRIVCDYGGIKDLFLLTVIDNATGADAKPTPRECAQFINWRGKTVGQYDITCKPREVLEALGLPQDGSVEGVVLRFDYPKGLHTRIKIKTDEYKRLHKLITGVNARHIWEAMRDGLSLEPLIERVPDEYYQWVKQTQKELLAQYTAIETRCREDFKPQSDRKATAMYFQTCQYPGILFSMLDGKDYAGHIWKLLRPAAAKAFRCDGDA